MGAKSLYLDRRSKILEQLRLANDLDMLAKIDKDMQAYLRYAASWTSANLDEYLERFRILDDKFNMQDNLRKISFFDDGRKYEIICAVGASYFRIIRSAYVDEHGVKHGDTYVTLDLKEPKVSGALRGKVAKAERERLTHFRMTYKKRGE